MASRTPWGQAAIIALDEKRVERIAQIFNARESDVNATVYAGSYGGFILARQGYRNRKLGPTHKAFEHGDTLLHLALRNDADPRFVAELLALGARTDIKNDSGHVAGDLDRPAFDAALLALENCHRKRRVDESYEPYLPNT